MALSKSSRIIILLVIDTAFFFLELITGYAVHSLALVADSFHMLNDVLSLCVGLWAVKMASRSSEQTPKMYTYGYQRAETLGALVNGVFLVALCVTIFLDAIQRFVEPQEVNQPMLVLIVGCLGLASNLVGLLLFHDHSHGGHSHGGHSHGGHSHAGHSHDNEVRDAEEGHAHGAHDDHAHSHEAGHAHKAGHSHSHKHSAGSEAVANMSPQSTRRTVTSESETTAVGESSGSPQRSRRRHSRSASRGLDFEGPKSFRQSIMQAANQLEDVVSEEGGEAAAADVDEHNDAHAHDTTSPLLGGQGQGYGSIQKSYDHQAHRHAQEKPKGKGAGHSHGDLNMRGIFLHVMGDALGNIGVIATALIIWLTDYSWRFYFDPAISLVITIIILCSAIPLCQAASRILLQAVPHGIEVDDIRADIEDLPGVDSCHHLHVWQLSDEKLIASLHVRVNFNFKGDGSAKYMDLAKAIRQCLHEYGIHSSTIQPEFCSPFDLAQSRQGSLDGSAHDHDGSPRAGSTQRTNSDAGSPSCLLDCDDNCEGSKSCCPPTPQPQAGDSQGHSH